MITPIPSDPDVAGGDSQDETPADEAETRKFLLDRSKRDNAPIPNVFIQDPDKSLKSRAAPLADFVRSGDVRGLRAFLLLHAFISSGEGENGWSATLPLKVWARAFDTTKTADVRSASSAATKILSRLVSRNLIVRTRSGRARNITVTLLRPDGSGDPYVRPDGLTVANRFTRLNHKYWTDGWYEQLDLAATAMLLVALHEDPDGFPLPTERVPDWYGWSADTAERGLKTLRDHGLIEVEKRVKKAPLAPSGVTTVNVYRLTPELAPPPPQKRPGAKKQASEATATNAPKKSSKKPKDSKAAKKAVGKK